VGNTAPNEETLTDDMAASCCFQLGARETHFALLHAVRHQIVLFKNFEMAKYGKADYWDTRYQLYVGGQLYLVVM
jgi:hypothetical protein